MLPVSLTLIPNERYPYETFLTLSNLTQKGENLLECRLIKKSLKLNIEGQVLTERSEPKSQFRTPLKYLKNNSVKREGNQ